MATLKEESRKRANHVTKNESTTSHDVVHEVHTIDLETFYLTHETCGVRKAVTEPYSHLKIVGPIGACRGHITALKEPKVKIPIGEEAVPNFTRDCC